eukprot:83091-Chlamydomonas_euryale.AAC.1
MSHSPSRTKRDAGCPSVPPRTKRDTGCPTVPPASIRDTGCPTVPPAPSGTRDVPQSLPHQAGYGMSLKGLRVLHTGRGMSLKGLRVLKSTVPRACVTLASQRDAGCPTKVSAPSGQNGRCVTLAS